MHEVTQLWRVWLGVRSVSDVWWAELARQPLSLVQTIASIGKLPALRLSLWGPWQCAVYMDGLAAQTGKALVSVCAARHVGKTAVCCVWVDRMLHEDMNWLVHLCSTSSGPDGNEIQSGIWKHYDSIATVNVWESKWLHLEGRLCSVWDWLCGCHSVRVAGRIVGQIDQCWGSTGTRQGLDWPGSRSQAPAHLP